MDISLWNDMYLDFRSKLLGPIYSTDEIFGIMARNIVNLALQANIGYIHCIYYVPVSQFAPNGISGEFTAYHDTARLPTIPSTTDFSETMSTGEQGSFTFQAHPVDGHSFTDNEKQLVQLLSWDFFILSGRAHLIGNTRKAAISDPMTGAYNQAGIFMFCQQVIGGNLADYTAYFINLKNFKYVNKSTSSQQGDLALKMYVNKISQFINDKEIVARLGGDNFFVLTKKVHQEEFISQFSNCEMTLGQGPKPVNIRIQARMGVYPIEDKVEIHDALNNAAMSLQAARAIKTRDVVFFSKEMLVRAMHQKEISNEFHNAIRNKEFVVFYQPKVDLLTRKLTGAEALVRWIRHKTIVPPMDFIPILEREGTICDLDFYVFETACADIRQWLDAGIEPHRISANFSKLHLRNPELANNVLSIVRKHNVPSKYVEVELTESADFDDNAAMMKFVNAMAENGIAVSIDDFGTGYSTLNVLKDYNITTIKLDKSLLDNVGTPNSKDDVIVRNVVKMANELNKEIIAEGVETETQAEYLKSIQCNNVQGFLFDKPLVHDDFQKRLTGEVVY